MNADMENVCFTCHNSSPQLCDRYMVKARRQSWQIYQMRTYIFAWKNSCLETLNIHNSISHNRNNRNTNGTLPKTMNNVGILADQFDGLLLFINFWYYINKRVGLVAQTNHLVCTCTRRLNSRIYIISLRTIWLRFKSTLLLSKASILRGLAEGLIGRCARL